ncbi:MAG TPA: right-handed parallel beta-helix repeat-containing protein [Hyphomicrobium sp.]|jgi:nitrous oxidase accessory protein NosD
MSVSRRELILAGLGFGVTLAAGARLASAHRTTPSTFGVAPLGSTADHTAMLQHAADAAAQSGRPLFLPPGLYSTGRLELRSGTHLTGIPGKSILRCRDGGGLIGVEQAADIRLDGLVLDGHGRDMGVDGALLAANMATRLQLSNCRFLRSGSGGILVSRCEDVVVTNNIVDKAATGIAVTEGAQGGSPALIQGNLVRNLFFRKVAVAHGNGIAIDADAVVKGNIVGNAPGFGILVSSAGDVSVSHNRIRNTHIGIGIPAEVAETARLASNKISNAQNGAIRAMRGPAPIGPDLADQRGAAAAAAF